MEKKKLVTGFVVLVATFGLGYFVAPQFKVDLTAKEFTNVNSGSTTITVMSEPPASIPQETAFAPEFRDLPNFEEIEYPEPNTSLIDIFQIGGIYRERDVIAKTGETWLTLFESNGNYSLKYAQAKVKRLKTASYAGDELDVRLTFDKPGVPILALRYFRTLRPGKVTSLYQRPSSEEIDRRNLPIGAMEDGYKQDFNLNEVWYTLRVSKGVSKDGTKLGLLVLENETQRQVILSTEYFPGDKIIIGDLFWVGDLDNDGKLDFYLDTYNEKGGGLGSNLFLSSAAEPGKLVKHVAMFGVPGC